MKKLPLIFLLLMASTVFPQEISKIYLTSGDMIKGKIIYTVPDVSIQVELKSGSIVTYQLSDVSRIEMIPIKSAGSLGVGIGIPYGVIGANAEYGVEKNLSLTAGVGTTGLAGTGYNLGIKYYLKDIGNTWRPRISAYYGTNGMILVTVFGGEDIEEAHPGLTVGVGQQWMWGDAKGHGLDLDLMYIVTSGMYDRRDEIEEEYNTTMEDLGRVKLSIGYRYGF
ncbi:MAG: hypothetical protein KAU50_11815 [Candidatus Marinimicrobia bacterium]|nr:hypothetical protein [Candidatus Neomarinimicrobiota bacterium]